MRFAQLQQKQHPPTKNLHSKIKKNGTGVSAPSALFQLYLSRAKIKSILMPPGKKGLGSFRRETIMIGFILLWGQKWEANSIVSVYMHDKAAKQIFKRD